jgi:hypothetical protein
MALQFSAGNIFLNSTPKSDEKNPAPQNKRKQPQFGREQIRPYGLQPNGCADKGEQVNAKGPARSHALAGELGF